MSIENERRRKGKRAQEEERVQTKEKDGDKKGNK